MRPPSLTAVQCAASPHSPAHAPCSPPATSHYTTGRLQAGDLCAPCRRLLHCGADFPAPTPPVREERSALRMAKKRSEPRRPSTPTAFEQARDELFSHILRCGVLEASAEHQKEWFDDTMLYLADRYEELDEPQLAVRRLRPDEREPQSRIGSESGAVAGPEQQLRRRLHAHPHHAVVVTACRAEREPPFATRPPRQAQLRTPEAARRQHHHRARARFGHHQGAPAPPPPPPPPPPPAALSANRPSPPGRRARLSSGPQKPRRASTTIAPAPASVTTRAPPPPPPPPVRA